MLSQTLPTPHLNASTIAEFPVLGVALATLVLTAETVVVTVLEESLLGNKKKAVQPQVHRFFIR